MPQLCPSTLPLGDVPIANWELASLIWSLYKPRDALLVCQVSPVEQFTAKQPHDACYKSCSKGLKVDPRNLILRTLLASQMKRDKNIKRDL